MHDMKMLDAVRAFGRHNLPALEALLSDTDGAAWGERLQGWLTACALSPHAALEPVALETAVVDLVTLELACQSCAPAEDGLLLTDRGGTVRARRTLADLLLILSQRDLKAARKLAVLAGDSRHERLVQVRTLIAERM